MVKKIMAVILALLMCFPMGVTCFAGESQEAESGNLQVTYVTENDENSEHEVTISIRKNLGVNDRIQSSFSGTYNMSDGSTITFSDGFAYVTLKSNDSFTIYDLPAGVYYFDVDTNGYSFTSEVEYAIISAGSTTTYTVYGNDRSFDIPVSVVWLDGDDAVRPEGIEICIYATVLGEEDEEVIYVTLNEENGWTYTFEDIIDADEWTGSYGLEINDSSFYYDGRRQYSYEITGNINSGYVITCTQILDTATSVQVIWDDNNDENEIRPWSVRISLLMNGEEIVNSGAHEAYYYVDEDGNRITLGKDWFVTFSQFDYYSTDKIDKTYTITAEDVEGYTYTITGSFEEGYTVTYKLADAAKDSQVDLSACSITLSATSYTYDGKAKTPAVTVTYNETTLTKGTDYTATYSNNINAGTATVTITGCGDYTGTVEKNYTINKATQTLHFRRLL